VVAETQAISAKEMHVDVPAPAVSFVLEMVMLNVLQTVTHFGFTAPERPSPENTSFPLDCHRHRYGLEFRIDHEFWPKRASAEFRARKVEIVFFLELMIGKLVAHSHADPIGQTIRRNYVDAGDFSFISAILGIGRNVERFSVCA
jgi:hypothetical protein